MSTLREAAQALLDAQLATLPERLYLVPAVRAALAALPPGPDDLQRMLEELWECGARTAGHTFAIADRDRRVRSILDLWPAKSEDDLR